MIEVINLTKKYGDCKAVDQLSFHIEKGQIYGFLGPNGAGKSTTMNILTGYLAPSEGVVKINGFDIQKNPEEAKKCIGYLPELPPVYMEMTVEEYLKFVSQLKKIPKAKRSAQIAEVMEATNVTDVKNRLIKNLSKGYRQRVGLAQAMLGNPEIIILDEPTVGLDPKQIIEIRELIKELGKEHTVILSSHILSEVRAVCDKIMIMSHGKLVASDTPEGLEHKMGNTNEISVSILGKKEDFSKLLASMEGIMELHIEEDDKTVRARITTDGKQDIREELFYLLANEHMPIMELSMEKKSLEEIFLLLTEDSTEKESEVEADVCNL